MKSNYVAFSLWDSTSLDLTALLRNVEFIRQAHPGWKVILYHDQTVGNSVLMELENLGVVLVDMSSSDTHPPVWKFLAAELPDAGYVIFSDRESGFRLDVKEDRLTQMEREGIASTTSNGAESGVISNDKNLSVLSYICGLMEPVVGLKKFIGGF